MLSLVGLSSQTFSGGGPSRDEGVDAADDTLIRFLPVSIAEAGTDPVFFFCFACIFRSSAFLAFSSAFYALSSAFLFISSCLCFFFSSCSLFFLSRSSICSCFFFSFSSSIASDEALVRSLAHGNGLGVFLEGVVTGGLVKNFDTTVCEHGVDDNKFGVGETLCSCPLKLHAAC